MIQPVQLSSLATGIDSRLQRIANVLLLNSSFIDNLGLLNGKVGIAIFFYNYARYSNSKIFSDYAGELLDEIYEEINTSTPVNFENGLTGIGWAIEYLVRNKFVQTNTDETLSETDNIVYRNSLYRPFLLDSGNDLFGYGLYFLARLREYGNDDDNLNTLFKKQHLIYLVDDCERILIQKKYTGFNIQSLSLDTINSFLWFLLEMHRWNIFPFKVEKIFHSLPEYFENYPGNTKDYAGAAQMRKFIECSVKCIRELKIKNLYKLFINKCHIKTTINETNEEEFVSNFIKATWQNLIYEPYISLHYTNISSTWDVFRIIDNEDNWNKRLDNLNKNNIGLTGFAGLGLGLLSALGIKQVSKSGEPRTKQLAFENLIKKSNNCNDFRSYQK